MELAFPFEIKSVDDDGQIEGIGAAYDNVDLGFDKIVRGAFREFLKNLKGSIPMLWQHDMREPIGVWDAISDGRDGLKVSGRINLDTSRGREARSLAKQGALGGLSIGYRALDYKYEGDVRVLSKLDVHEVSLVTFPMNPEARIGGVKHGSRAWTERVLRDTFNLSNRGAKHVAAVIRNYEIDEETPPSEKDELKSSLEELKRTLRS